jgi:CDP-diacylglycerol--serine O-phosphatidyltransferase
MALIAFLLISNVPTLSWSKLRPRRNIRIEVIALVALVVAALLTEPWLTLIGISVIYLLLIPIGVVSYLRIRRLRAGRAAQGAADAP